MRDPYILKDGTLKNLLGITEYNQLKNAERDIGFIKLTSIGETFSSNFDSSLFQRIHKHIFGDIFSWAGQFRTIPIYKEEVVIPGLSLEYANYRKIPKLLEKNFTDFNNVDWTSLNIDEKTKKFTNLLAKLWKVHPFRDGNTRTTMAFAAIFAREHNFPMDFDIILSNFSRQTDDFGKITRYSIRDKFVLAALDEKDYPEPQHLELLLRQSITSGISKKIEALSAQMHTSQSDNSDLTR